MWYEEWELDKWKSIIAKWYLIPITKFLWNKSSINKFTDTVLKVCEIIQNDWKHTSILSDALKVFNNQWKTEGDEEKIKRCRKFYSKYWKILSDSLNMLNISDTWEDSKYADVIVLNKDKEWNQILKDYYNQFKSPDIPLFDNEDLMTDPFLYAGTSWIDIKKATTDILWLMTWWTLKKKRAAPHFWKEITDSFNAIANKKYSSNDDRTTKLKHELRYLLAWFMENNWWSEDFISSYNSPSFMFSRLNDWWVYLKDLSQLWISIDDMESWNNQKFEKVLWKYVDQIIKFERWEHESYRKDEKDPWWLTSIVDITKKATNNTVSDDYDQQIAA